HRRLSELQGRGAAVRVGGIRPPHVRDGLPVRRDEVHRGEIAAGGARGRARGIGEELSEREVQDGDLLDRLRPGEEIEQAAADLGGVRDRGPSPEDDLRAGSAAVGDGGEGPGYPVRGGAGDEPDHELGRPGADAGERIGGRAGRGAGWIGHGAPGAAPVSPATARRRLSPARARRAAASSGVVWVASMTIATGTRPPARASASAAWASETPAAAATILTARRRSFSFVARRSTIRFPYTLPSRTIARVLSMLSTSFCAVPALRRVLPAMTSGPTTGAISRSHSEASGESATHVTAMVVAPRPRARRAAASTYGVAPPAAIATTTSFGPTARASISRSPARSSSSAPSTASVSARGAPARTACT